MVVAVAVTAGNLLFCSMLGYALAMLDFRGKKFVFVVVMATLMIPGVVTFVPLFVLVANAGLIDTLPGPDPAVPRQPVRRLPHAAVHPRPAARPARRRPGGRRRRAAHLRAGSSCRCAARRWRRWGSSPSSAAGTTSSGRSSWPRPRTHYTLPVALALYSTGQNCTQYGLLLAGATVVVLPILAVFLVFQRRFIEGIATTGIK